MSIFQQHLEKVERVLAEAEQYLLDSPRSNRAVSRVADLRATAFQLEDADNAARDLPSFVTSCHLAIESLNDCATSDYLREERHAAFQPMLDASERVTDQYNCLIADENVPEAQKVKLKEFYESMGNKWPYLEPPFNHAEDRPSVLKPRGLDRIDSRFANYASLVLQQVNEMELSFGELSDPSNYVHEEPDLQEPVVDEVEELSPFVEPVNNAPDSPDIHREIEHGEALGLSAEEILENIKRRTADES